MTDKEMVEHIHTLVDTYHVLEKQHHGLALSDEQRKQLADIQVEVDRRWEQLRRARAQRRTEEMASMAPMTAPPWAAP